MEADLASGPHSAGQWNRGEETAECRMPVLAKLCRWKRRQKVDPVPERGKGIAFSQRLLLPKRGLHEMRLREVERSQREALSKRIEETRLSLEAEEAEIARIRDQLTPEEFETRFRAFDQRAREARLEVQRANEALQAQMIAAL